MGIEVAITIFSMIIFFMTNDGICHMGIEVAITENYDDWLMTNIPFSRGIPISTNQFFKGRT